MTCSSPCAIQARDWPPPLSRSLQGLPHDQAQCPGTRAVDLSLDHRRARRTIVGERQFAPGRGFSIHVAHQTRRFSAPMMCRRAPACSDPRRPLCGRKPRSSHRVSKGSCWRAAKARRSLGSPRLLKSASSRFPPFNLERQQRAESAPCLIVFPSDPAGSGAAGRRDSCHSISSAK